MPDCLGYLHTKTYILHLTLKQTGSQRKFANTGKIESYFFTSLKASPLHSGLIVIEPRMWRIRPHTVSYKNHDVMRTNA